MIDSTEYQVRVSLRENLHLLAEQQARVDAWLLSVSRVVARVFNNKLRRERLQLHLPKRLRHPAA